MSSPRTEHNAQALSQLCAHFGIATEYDDIWGMRHPVARASLLALLSDFGVTRADESNAPDALDAVLRCAWRQALPPVVAIRASALEWNLSLRLPASLARIRWQLREETGTVHQGEVAADALPEIDRTELDGVSWCERKLSFSLRLAAGYHRLSVADLAGETLVVSAPERCYRPAALPNGGKAWGPTVQLYALRSPRNWGIGDFSDLAQLVAQMAERGADIIGINPLHALFVHNPAHASPYSPSSRLQLNVLYIDVEAVDDYASCGALARLVHSFEFQGRLARLREAPLVDYVGVAAVKFEALELLFSHFREHHLTPDGLQAGDDAGRAFLAFVVQGGEALYRHALFEALQAHFHANDAAIGGWPGWPLAYQDPDGAEVKSFAEQHGERVQYHQYLQWLAASQLARASDYCQTLGMGVGLYVDLAVSVDRAGSDVWCERACFAANASIGAPPDEFNPNGQG